MLDEPSSKHIMKTQILTFTVSLLLTFGMASAQNPMGGGQSMFENKNIV